MENGVVDLDGRNIEFGAEILRRVMGEMPRNLAICFCGTP
jgi:hypothetical protein